MTFSLGFNSNVNISVRFELVGIPFGFGPLLNGNPFVECV